MVSKTGLQVGQQAGQIPRLGSMNERFKLWRSMLAIYQNHPYLGTGIASFSVLYRSYRDPTELSAGHYGHNDYLQFLQEGGPVSLGFILLPLLLISWIVLNNCKKGNKNLIITAYALASATFFIHAAADIIFYAYGPALLAGLFLSMAYHQLPNSEEPRPVCLHRPKLTIAATGLGLFIFWAGLALDSYITTRLEWQYYGGKVYPASVTESPQQLLALHKLRPDNPSPLIRLAEAFMFMMREVKDEKTREELATPALYYSLKYLNQSPRTSQIYVRLAELAQLQPNMQIADLMQPFGINASRNLSLQLLKKALQMDPGNRLATLKLAEYHQSRQDNSKALQVLNNAIPWFTATKSLISLEAYRQDEKYKEQIQSKIKALQQL